MIDADTQSASQDREFTRLRGPIKADIVWPLIWD